MNDANTSGAGLNPKQLFDLVSKNYENWSQAMAKQFENDLNDTNFSPFPNEDNNSSSSLAMNDKSNPIFNYSLLDALDATSGGFSEQIKEVSSITNMKPTKGKRKILDPQTHNLLNEQEIDFVRHKITQIIQNSGESTEGFTLYDTKDEEGLHSGNSDFCTCCGDDDANQDDYDLEEITGDENYAYSVPPTHHIEVELNTAPECEEHGMEGCDCPIFDDDDDDDHDEDEDDSDDGPSCEFMFEYDSNGNLIPTYNNVAEKIREIQANGGVYPSKRKKKNKKKNKKKRPTCEATETSKSEQETPSTSPITKSSDLEKFKEMSIPRNQLHNKVTTIPKNYYGYIPYDQCCLFCEYEAVFGAKPKQMIKWYDQKIHAEEKRRQEFKRKLQNAKSKALRKQKDMRQRTMQQKQQQTNEAKPVKTENKIDEVD
ncbi:hypothetical protein SBY92_004845 [Candida maltosa Xu316]